MKKRQETEAAPLHKAKAAMRTRQMPYRWLAEYYDTIFDFHEGWSEAAQSAILGRLLPRVRTACDLACGSGTTVVKMGRRGIRMFGVDLSPGMCRAARKKARAAKLSLNISRQDMR